VLFEPADRVDDPRLGDAKVARGVHEALPLGHPGENRQRTQVEHGQTYHCQQ
jgi:hypothetical protein